MAARAWKRLRRARGGAIEDGDEIARVAARFAKHGSSLRRKIDDCEAACYGNNGDHAGSTRRFYRALKTSPTGRPNEDRPYRTTRRGAEEQMTRPFGDHVGPSTWNALVSSRSPPPFDAHADVELAAGQLW
jgi:uncharacterized protein YjhX (UPF0386 family)